MMDKKQMLEELHREIVACRKCDLFRGRTKAVPGEGNPNALIMFVGEAPGREEDLQGRPFVGAAGKLLGQLLGSIGLQREEVFIGNVIKCRPPYNRDPLPKEIETCKDYLFAQISIIQPKIICLLGRFALHLLMGENLAISRVHGIAQEKDKIIFLPLYHPAAGLHNENLKRVMAKDFLRLKDLMGLVEKRC